MSIRRRWWALAIVVAAQLMFSVDAFIVNVGIRNSAVDLSTLALCALSIAAFPSWMRHARNN